ncbi:MAG: DNA mismatch repair protein MutS [Planctomycetota bacterium]|jgi:DNA mismatch repair protein MutS
MPVSSPIARFQRFGARRSRVFKDPEIATQNCPDTLARPEPPRAPMPKPSPSPTDSTSDVGASKTSGSSKPRGGKAKRPKTGMMDQYWAAKKEQPGAMLFFRMGDFYELFHDDAVEASRRLGITLTSRSKGENPVPMAGFPVKAAEGYLLKLVRMGVKVAICEQLTDPRKTKGIVDRGIVRVVTPGTLTEEHALDARANNYLASLWPGGDRKKGESMAGLAWIDLSTGRFQVCQIPHANIVDEVARIQPAELLWPSGIEDQHPELAGELGRMLGPRVSERDVWRFERDTAQRGLRRHFNVATLEGFGVSDDCMSIPAAGALMEYVEETQRSACEHIRSIQAIVPTDHLILDRATRACLELTETQRDGRREGSLLDSIDSCVTPMGGRMLRQWVLSPLCKVEPILFRQNAIAELVEKVFLREDLRDELGRVHDLERLIAKVSTGRANARDLSSIGDSLTSVPLLKSKLSIAESAGLMDVAAQLDPLEELNRRISDTIVDEPPVQIKDGGVIRPGVSEELDELREIAGAGKTWMAKFQASEIERTGLVGLKIGYNSVFGYYLEVPRGQVSQVPETYIRKQTIKASERYITPELKEYETKVLQSEERSRDLEYDLFVELRDDVAKAAGRVLDTAQSVATLDVYAGLAESAGKYQYVAPTVNDDGAIHIVEGRHPVIERSDSCDSFVPNDATLDHENAKLTILTGPNMAGKSTYIRQVAVIALLAQVGSFVPAQAATIGICDRIFTRVGAGDDISRGASTFMVEMVEIANIVNNATPRSLVVLDEVGRGTSTFDGLALAWAIAEHIHSNVGARTIFATHYHQLTELAERLPGVANLNVAVREMGEEIVFLHKIVKGGTDRSYGIHVARLAGVPSELLTRAQEILAHLEEEAGGLAPLVAGATPRTTLIPQTPPTQQLTFFGSGEPSAVEQALEEIDVDAMTPIQALLKLKELKDLS